MYGKATQLNNHRNHIKRGVNSYELSELFLHDSRSHDFGQDVTITIIEQIKQSKLEKDFGKVS